MNKEITAVIFDYGGVIEISELAIGPQIADILGVTRDEWVSVYYQHNQLTNVEGKDWKEAARTTAEQLGATPEQVEQLFDVLDRSNETRKVNDELLDMIRKIKSLGFKTAVLSNYNTLLRPKMTAQGISDIFDEIIISCEEGYQKPDPRLFEIAFDKLGVEASEVIFIDDSPRSLSTATEIGYTPILYTDNTTLKQALLDSGLNL